MLIRALLIAFVAVGLTAACSGDDDPAEDAPAAVPSSFTEIVRAELVRAGFDVEPGTDLKLTAEQGPNSVELDLQEAFDRVEDDPDSRDEIVDEVVADTQERFETGIGELSFEDARENLMPLLKAGFQIRRFGFDAAETEQPADLATVYAVDPTTRSRSSRPRTSSGGARPSRRSTRSRSTTSRARRTRTSRFSASPPVASSFAAGRRVTATTPRV